MESGVVGAVFVGEREASDLTPLNFAGGGTTLGSIPESEGVLVSFDASGAACRTFSGVSSGSCQDVSSGVGSTVARGISFEALLRGTSGIAFGVASTLSSGTFVGISVGVSSGILINTVFGLSAAASFVSEEIFCGIFSARSTGASLAGAFLGDLSGVSRAGTTGGTKATVLRGLRPSFGEDAANRGPLISMSIDSRYVCENRGIIVGVRRTGQRIE